MTSEQKSSFKIDPDSVAEKIKTLVHEGNVRRLSVKRGDEVIAEFPLTVVAPVLAAVGAIAALVTDCTIEVEHTEQSGTPGTGA
jgi:hypothetical protein